MKKPFERALLERRSIYIDTPARGGAEAGRCDAPVYARAALKPGNAFAGPALVEQYDSCTLVAPGWLARDRSLRKHRAGARAMIDPVTSEVIKTALIYAAEEMGIAVRNAAHSPNIKERLDHSCALFDRRGRLIAQAEHIPVHLGSLPWGLARTLAVLAERGTALEPGEMWVVNDPYVAGTHLNDITVIRPIFAAGEGDGAARLAGYAANKAHHADVGGSVPDRCRRMRASSTSKGS